MRHTVIIFLAALFLVGSTEETNCTQLNCCEVSKAILKKCATAHKLCPGYVGFGYLRDNSTDPDDQCGPCPAGLCRVGTTCACPEEFMKSAVLTKQCATSHQAEWPESVGKTDMNCSHLFATKEGNAGESRWRAILTKKRWESMPGIVSAALVAMVAGGFYSFMQWRRQQH